MGGDVYGLGCRRIFGDDLLGHGLLRGHAGNCRSVGPSIGSTVRCRGWFAGFTGKELFFDSLSVDRAGVRIGNMITILAVITVGVIAAAGS